MKDLNFIQLQKDNEEHYNLLESLMIPYNIELDSHHHRQTPKEFIQKITHGMLNMQGAFDRHLEFCYDGDTLIGFLYGKVDHEGHKGFIKPECGYIMEFYVKPEFRRMGYGKAMYGRLEQLFASHEARRMYLTADPVTGKPFWESLGFVTTGETSPENGLMIYEKEITIYHARPTMVDDTRFITMIYRKNADVLHGNMITFNEWKQLLSENDPDEAHFIIHKGAIPCGWLKINGLLNADMAWISMLAVEPKMQHQGVGTYAVKFAEDFIRSNGFSKVGIHTTEDNIPAQNLYEKCGYTVTAYDDCTTGDGIKRMGYAFEKEI